MNIKIQSRNFVLTEALKHHILTKLQPSIARYEHKIRKAEVTLSDINGPKGGDDKKCVIKLRINHLKTIVVVEVSKDMYSSISNCALRVRRSLDKQFDRGRKLTRKVTFA